MPTQQVQVKLNLPLPLKDYLESKASKFGMPIAGYLRHLILKDIEGMEYPTFEASDRTIQSYKKALAEKDKAIHVNNIDEFLKNL